MTVNQNLAAAPYYDDQDPDKNYYRVLFKPGVAVQTRELNQIASILQDQINMFGSSIYQNGSVIQGCAFTFDPQYNYAKLNDSYANNYAIGNVGDFIGATATNGNGLRAIIVNAVPGYQSQDPDLNTIYCKYLNSATFANGSSQNVFLAGENLVLATSANTSLGNVVITTAANAVGTGYAFTTTDGIIFKDGYFIHVSPQTIIAGKYSNYIDDVSIGFEVDQLFITASIDTSLNDNATGSPNFKAPGADRFKLVPNLVTRATSDTANTTSFFSLCDFQRGLPVTVKNDPQYNNIAKTLAQRTYETNGNYVVNTFAVTTANSSNGYLNAVVSPGVAYVYGYRVEFINKYYMPLRMGTDFQSTNNQVVSVNFGYYYNVTQFVGDFNNNTLAQVELHNVSKRALSSDSFLNVPYSAGSKIGTAYCRGVEYSTGTPGVDAVYRLYLFDIVMNPGQSINNIQSVISYNGSNITAVADVVLQYNATTVMDQPVIQDPSNQAMVYYFGQNAIVPGGFSGQSFEYRRRSNTNFSNAGIATVSLSAVHGVGSEQFATLGAYSPSAESTFIITPLSNGFSSAKTGTVTVSSTNNVVTGSGTLFTSSSNGYYVGDYLFANNATRCVVSIANDTYMTVDNVFGFTASSLAHQKTFPAGVPINFQGAGSRTITATANVATLTLGETVNGTFQTSVYYDVLRSGTYPLNKVINRSTYVKINCANNAGGRTGPWCLGLADVLKINGVWVGTDGTYSTSNRNMTSDFTLDNGQRDAYYGLSVIASGSPVAANATILVCVDNFTVDASQGVGFFTAGSYPINDGIINGANTINTLEIPVYNSVTSQEVLDLRDCVDFRTFAVNTAIANASSIDTATINPSNTLTFYTYTTDNAAYVVSPDSAFIATVEHFLPRIDRVVLTQTNKMNIIEGISANKPAPPPPVPGTMTIAIANIPAYPSLTPQAAVATGRYDHAVDVKLTQTRRFTMADIGNISKRVDRLEYFTSLSSLEQSVNGQQLRNSVTGLGVFKNGMFIDPLCDHTMGNTKDPNYNISIDQGNNVARPAVTVFNCGVYYDATDSTNIVQTGNILTLAYDSVVDQQELLASNYRNCVAGTGGPLANTANGSGSNTTSNNSSNTTYTWNGSLKLVPSGYTIDDIRNRIQVCGDYDNHPNYDWPTIWGSWIRSVPAEIETPVVQGVSSNNQSTTVTPFSSNAAGVSTQLSKTNSATAQNPSNFQTFIVPGVIIFIASGLKPNTPIHAFFGDVPIDSVVRQITEFPYPYSKSVFLRNGRYFDADGFGLFGCPPEFFGYTSPYPAFINAFFGRYWHRLGPGWGQGLTSDNNGNLRGLFYIPANTFLTQDTEILLTDSKDPLIKGTTSASAIFHIRTDADHDQCPDQPCYVANNATQPPSNFNITFSPPNSISSNDNRAQFSWFIQGSGWPAQWYLYYSVSPGFNNANGQPSKIQTGPVFFADYFGVSAKPSYSLTANGIMNVTIAPNVNNVITAIMTDTDNNVLASNTYIFAGPVSTNPVSNTYLQAANIPADVTTLHQGTSTVTTPANTKIGLPHLR